MNRLLAWVCVFLLCASAEAAQVTIPNNVTVTVGVTSCTSEQCKVTIGDKTVSVKIKDAVTPVDPVVPIKPDDPVIDPVPSGAWRIDYTLGTSKSQDYVKGNVTARSGHGNRIFCATSHLSYDDSILYRGQPGRAHLHMFFGNTTTDAYSDPETLPFVGNSSCEGGTNYRSGIWMPALFNYQDEVVIPDYALLYYKKFMPKSQNMNFNHLQIIPQGLEMLARDDTNNYSRGDIRVDPNARKDGKVWYRVEMSFPSCVALRQGKPVLSYKDMTGIHKSGKPNNQVVNSHVSYMGGPSPNSVNCPPSHPYGFITPTLIVYFDRNTVLGKNGRGSPYVSSDKMDGVPNMTSLHADYVFGMEEQVNKTMLECVKESRNCRFKFNDRNGSESRLKDKSGRYIYNSVSKLNNSMDRTPFGNTLKPMQGSAHQH